MKHILKFSVFFLFVCFSSNAVLNFSDIEFYKEDPKTYTLLCLDASLSLKGSGSQWDESFKDIGVYLSKQLLKLKTEGKLSLKSQKEPPKDSSIKKWLRRKSIGSGKNKGYIVDLFVKQGERSVDAFMNRVFAVTDFSTLGFRREASLIVFPTQDEKKAMAYGFGHWISLVNSRIILPNWGLQLVTSVEVCNPSKVRVVKASNLSKGIPSTREDHSSGLDKIESFGFEVGAEGLNMLRVLPNDKLPFEQVLKGADYFQFDVSDKQRSSNNTSKTIQTLRSVAKSFYDYSTDKEFSCHDRLVSFLDYQIQDRILCGYLDNELAKIIKTKKGAKHLIFLDSSVFSAYQGKTLYFGEGNSSTRSIWPAINEEKEDSKFSLTTTIKIQKGQKSKEYFEEELGHLIFSLPIEYKGNFYRYKRGWWFKVDDSRFGRIKKLLRHSKVDASTIDLPSYTYDDTIKDPQDPTGYAESNYNKRVVREIVEGGGEASLLDRINIQLGSSRDKFEFSDLLIKKGKKFYLVHVKRAAANALSHHREQLERSADYLAGELKRPGSENFLLQAAINDMYMLHNVPQKKKNGLTYGNIFENKKIKISDLFRRNANKRPSDKALALKYDLVTLVSNSGFNKKFFDANLDAFYDGINTLYDCVNEGTLDLKAKPSKEKIKGFFDKVKNSLESQKILFQKGHLAKDKRSKITLVLAVVDDRRVKTHTEKKKKLKKLQKEYDSFDSSVDRSDIYYKPKNPLFHKQDLWGLDRTRIFVQSKGFGFQIMVINEYKSEEQDAFGEIQEDEPVISDESDEEEEAAKPPSKTKHKSKKPKKKYFSPSTPLLDVGRKLNLGNSQKLKYTENPEAGLFKEYYTCPTVGDGDCFFHAIFTNQGDDYSSVSSKAGEMRRKFVTAVQSGQYVNDLRPLVYEEYKDFHSNGNDGDIPTAILIKFQENDEYERARSFAVKMKVDPLPEYLQQPPYTEDTIRENIEEEEVKKYVKRFKEAGGEDSYIPFREGMKCPAEILANINKININVFTFNKLSAKLHLLKAINTPGAAKTINVLHSGSHFMRLFNPNEGDEMKEAAIQVIENFSL